MMMMWASAAPGCNDMPVIVPPRPRNVNHLPPPDGLHPHRGVDDPVDERWTKEELLGTASVSGG
jgi:hypothetical protein